MADVSVTKSASCAVGLTTAVEGTTMNPEVKVYVRKARGNIRTITRTWGGGGKGFIVVGYNKEIGETITYDRPVPQDPYPVTIF